MYMFNPLAFNPAYAGSKESLQLTALVRNQWTGIDGAPKTNILSIHSPFRNRKNGWGATLMSDKIGPKNCLGVSGIYSYTLQLKRARLAFGLKAGILNYQYNWAAINYRDPNDIYNNNLPTRKMTGTADFGLYYYNEIFYAALAATHLENGTITPTAPINGYTSELRRHYFFTLGKGFPVNPSVVVNPSIMARYLPNTPLNLDVNCNVLLHKTWWFGISLRYQYGAIFLCQYQFKNNLKVGYSYDLGISKIGKAGMQSHEIMLGYSINIFHHKMVSPRYL